MVEKKVNNINPEKIETAKVDLGLFKKRSSAHSAKGVVIGFMKRIMNSDSDTFSKQEMAMVFSELYKKIGALEESKKVRLDSWKGKSSFQVIVKPDKFLVVTYQKRDQDTEPIEIKREITKDEVNDVLYWINRIHLDKNIDKIPTRDIGEKCYQKKWDEIFSDRFQHTQLNLILRLLDYFKITHYRGRFSTILKKTSKIQTILKNQNV